MHTPPCTPIDKSPDRIRRMFGSIAPRYDLINRILTLGIDFLWRYYTAKTLVQKLPIEGDVLDVCCGTGELSLAFRKSVNKTNAVADIFGIDFSPEMIAVAQKKAQKHSGVHFTEGDALQLPFEDNRFAVVAVAFGLRNVCDPQRGLTEMIRVCKPAGRVAVLDFSMPALPVVKQCYQFYFHTILPGLGQWLGRNQDQAYHYLPESVLQFDNPEQLAERLRQLGVAEVQKMPMTLGIVTLVWGRKGT